MDSSSLVLSNFTFLNNYWRIIDIDSWSCMLLNNLIVFYQEFAFIGLLMHTVQYNPIFWVMNYIIFIYLKRRNCQIRNRNPIFLIFIDFIRNNLNFDIMSWKLIWMNIYCCSLVIIDTIVSYVYYSWLFFLITLL